MKKTLLYDGLLITLGSAVMALGVSLFFAPLGILPGGLTSAGIVVNHFFPQAPVGVTVLVLNVPLFVFGFRLLGRGFLVRTAIGTVASSLLVDLFALIPAPECGSLAAAAFGGALMGAGQGLVFARNGTTGGTDMLARILKFKFPSTQMGALVMAVDCAAVLLALVVYRSADAAFYAVASIFVSAKVMDAILYGIYEQWSVFVVTDAPERIMSEIHVKLERGVTIIPAVGGYTGEPRKLLLTAVGKQELNALKALVKETDENAFVIVNTAYDILGEGFRSYDRNRV